MRENPKSYKVYSSLQSLIEVDSAAWRDKRIRVDEHSAKKASSLYQIMKQPISTEFMNYAVWSQEILLATSQYILQWQLKNKHFWCQILLWTGYAYSINSYWIVAVSFATFYLEVIFASIYLANYIEFFRFTLLLSHFSG